MLIKKVMFWILLFSILFGLITDTWCRPEPQNIKGPRNQHAEIIDINQNQITIRQHGAVRSLPLKPELKIFRQVKVTSKSMTLGAPVLIQGQNIGEGAVRARIIVLLSPWSFEELRKASSDGMRFVKNSGTIVSLSPLRIKRLSSTHPFEVKSDGHTIILKEKAISISDLRVGDTVRLLRGKIVKLPDLQQGNSPGKALAVRLPEVPLPGSSGYDPQIANAGLSSPFGFFDPNMLRFHHLKVYNDFAQTMDDLDVHWAAFGATFSFNWNLILDEAGQDRFNWDRIDRLIRLCQNHNIHVIGYIKANEPNDKPGPKGRRIPSLPRNMSNYKKFVRAVVERFDGDGVDDMPGLKLPIKYWSIEDEPLAPIYFSGSGADYAKLVHAASLTIRSADPDAKVIVSMIRGTGWLKKAGDPRAFMLSFFEQLAKLTDTTPYDILDQHWIGVAPNIPAAEQYKVYAKWLEDLDTTARHYGFTKVPFVNLELAGTVTSEKKHAADLVKRHIFLLAQGVKKIFWSGIKAVSDQDLASKDKENYFRQVTLIDGNGRHKLAYQAYKLMVSIFDGADWPETHTLKNNQDGSFIFKFLKDKKPIWVIWNDDHKSEERITVPVGGKHVTVIQAVSGDNADQVVNEKNQILIKASNLPVFVLVD